MSYELLGFLVQESQSTSCYRVVSVERDLGLELRDSIPYIPCYMEQAMYHWTEYHPKEVAHEDALEKAKELAANHNVPYKEDEDIY